MMKGVKHINYFWNWFKNCLFFIYIDLLYFYFKIFINFLSKKHLNTKKVNKIKQSKLFDVKFEDDPTNANQTWLFLIATIFYY